MDRDLLERYLTEGKSLPEIGRLVGRHPSTVGYWVQKHGLVANGKQKYSPRGGLTREQLEPLVEQSFSQARIAATLGVSVSTVRHWLRKYGFETDAGYRRRQRRLAAANRTGVREAIMRCRRHSDTEFALDSRGSWRCLRCRAEAVQRRRRLVKSILVNENGGCCAACGYDRYEGALQFHHLDPANKGFAISHKGFTRSLAQVRREARKCILLCANCHAEVEAGYRKLEPAKQLTLRA
jgi:transposase